MSDPTIESPANLLLVEDDPGIRDWLVESLVEHGHRVDVCSSMGEARARLEPRHDLLLLDLGLPDGDGIELCRELRSESARTPVIILTAREAIEERVRGLDSGADDYLTKPFEVPELLARIRSVLRRSDRRDGSSRMSCGELWVDPTNRTAGRHDREIELRRREFDLLSFLMRSPGRAWTRDQLLDAVWGPTWAGDTRTVDMCVQRLRARIEDDSRDPVFVETVWGVGYRMRELP